MTISAKDGRGGTSQCSRFLMQAEAFSVIDRAFESFGQVFEVKVDDVVVTPEMLERRETREEKNNAKSISLNVC